MLKRGVFVLLFIVFSSSAYSLIGDFDLNNEVNFNDFVQFARAFGEFNVENSEGETFYDSH
ncbi:hypothetical protein HYT56_05425, partial [Candidatus Woesearchaeota archaeon]|nr:hypothetical protein [Candidatus Woesearchaeota archaeon]